MQKENLNIISNNLLAYSITSLVYNTFVIDSILLNNRSHIVSLFKDGLILNEDSEFFSRFYNKGESNKRLQQLLDYYNASSMLFPNYTALDEKKYIYKNIMKKQKVIDLMEELDDKKKEDNVLYINYTNGVKEEKDDRVFDTKIYESIALEQDISKIKELFGDNLNESIEVVNKFTNYLSEIIEKSIESHSHIKKYNKIKLVLSKDIKHSIKAKLNIKLSSKHQNVLTMPMIKPQKKNSSKDNKPLIISHTYLHSMPNELNSYRSRQKRLISSSNLYETITNNNYTCTVNNTNSNRTVTKKVKLNIDDRNKKYLKSYIRNGLLTERKTQKKIFLIKH